MFLSVEYAKKGRGIGEELRRDLESVYMCERMLVLLSVFFYGAGAFLGLRV